MQDFLHASQDDVLEAVERFERMVSTDKEVYFDVHQVENIFEFYLDKNLIDQAEQILAIGLKQHPQATSLKVKKAGLLADNNQLEQALILLQEVAPIESTNYEVFITMGWVKMRLGKIKEAVAHFHKAVDMAFDDEEDILLEIAYNMHQEEIYDESIPFLNKLISKNPTHENALFELAFAMDKNGKRKESIQLYERLLDVNPFSENGWYNIGILYNKEERFLDASRAYDFTLAINPLHSEAYFNKGNSLAFNGCFKEALDAYLEHISLSNDVLLTYQYIADCWEQMGNYDMAIRFYKLITKELPDSGDAWYGLGTAQMEKEDFKEGLQAIDEAISKNPVNADYWFAHARGLFELDKAEDATRSLENGLNIDPEEFSGWIELFKLKQSLDENFNANTYLLEIKDRYQGVAAINYLGTIIYFKYLKNIPAAIKELKIALDTSHDNLNTLLEELPELLEVKEIKELLP
ncbi:tetratricopeptide repeat protein [Carboxylicivirga sp. N1Y90]|uniref:tetratricopeptide repeat protein n=1 Tax=Carboxylicivirga fragile TaxID=3417571 RepID=UPI003D343C8D|nr:tetratricopeptide repeat protein [Marinilabiliaceae bacterium N1Y90]